MLEEELGPELLTLLEEARRVFNAAPNEDVLHQVKAQFLGKQGHLRELMGRLPTLPPEERKAWGQEVNRLKVSIEALLEERKAGLRRERRAQDIASTFVDLTLPGRAPLPGTAHPLRLVEDQIVDVFRDMGYDVASGPQVETDFHNFEALNFPPDHPARDMQDTFHLEGGRLLRTHTSGMQIRAMLANEPPLRLVAPGAVFRRDDFDARHSPSFHQVEGLVVDRGITLAHLKGTLEVFAARFFGADTRIRLRPSFFPFTEPSAEVDALCPACGGSGCGVCSQSGWIEILGCGMVHPNVFRAVGLDPEVWTGFAFGIGVERTAMRLFGVHDIRDFYTNDLRFLSAFR